jgi:hypothetical protein
MDRPSVDIFRPTLTRLYSLWPEVLYPRANTRPTAVSTRAPATTVIVGRDARRLRIARRFPADRTEPIDPAESIEATEPAEPIENAEPKEPAEPIERIEPLEPIESMEPSEPSERIESRDAYDRKPFSFMLSRVPSRAFFNRAVAAGRSTEAALRRTRSTR